MKRLHLAALLLVLGELLSAQQGGSIAGLVQDRTGGGVSDADVRLQSDETGARRSLRSDATGRYSSAELMPGSYQITVRRAGFRTVVQANVKVAAGDQVRVDFVMDLLPLQQDVTVSAAPNDVDPAASGLRLSRQGQTVDLPQNGHDVHALVSLVPGATLAPASISAGGQFTVTGQRPNANSFRVDDISGNVGIGVVAAPGVFPGQSLPGMNVVGSMQNLASREETDNVEFKSTDFDAQSGDRPGAVVKIETRAGSDEFHGAIFGSIRPHTLDSRDWFARGAGLNLPTAYMSGFGGGFGGPVWRKRTFFFCAYEQTDLRDSAMRILAVPSQATRASPLLSPYQILLGFFPAPAGPRLNALESMGYDALRKNARTTNRSLRLDQIITSHLQAFVRYSEAPSASSSTQLGAVHSRFGWTSLTAGLNLALGGVTQEMRFNFTHAASKSTNEGLDAATADEVNRALGDGFLGGWLTAQISMAGVGSQSVGAAGDASQVQLAGSYILAGHSHSNDLRFGGDYKWLEAGNNIEDNLLSYGDPYLSGPFYTFDVASVVLPDIQSLLQGKPLGLTGAVGEIPSLPTEAFSVFAEDTVHASEKITVLFGARWDATPPSYFIGIYPAYFSVAYWDGEGSKPVAINSSASATRTLWPADWTQIAPRAALAYRLRSSLIFRAGAGLFYDTGLGSILSNTNPLTIWQYLPNSANPISTSNPVSVPASRLSLPRVWEWRASIDKTFGGKSQAAIAYLGSSGSRLLRNEAAVDSQSSVLDWTEFTTRGRSSYQALLTNMRANLGSNLFALGSYSWSHSIDTGSSDTAPVLAAGPSNRGTSSFDVRQIFTGSVSYRTPANFGRVFGRWTVGTNVFVRSGFPFRVTTADETVGLGFENADLASLVSGQPIWIDSGAVPGGRRLNPAAFRVPANGESGTLGRNVLTGPGVFQIDTSLRRQMKLYGGMSIETVVSAFNLLNHPAFANPVSYAGSALFGESNSMASLMMGSGGPSAGLTPLFQAGGPRTIEMALRFSF